MDHVFIYQHSMRAEWGYCAVQDAQDDRTTFRFEDGSTRTIKQDHIHLMVAMDLPDAEAHEIRKRLARPAKAAAKASAKKKAPKKPKATAEAAAPVE